MAWASGGLQHSNGAGNLVFAQHPNAQIMAAKGNKVVSGCAVTEDATPDLTVDVAAGTVIANGIVVAVSAVDPYSGTPVTFATSQGNLTSGQAQFVMIHVDSSGVITNTEGTAAAAGQQLPPDVPEDETILAMITLTEGDSTIDTVDIEDWRIFTPDTLFGLNLTLGTSTSGSKLLIPDGHIQVGSSGFAGPSPVDGHIYTERGIEVNTSKDAWDLIVHGDTIDNLFLVDGSEDHVIINGNMGISITPTVPLQVNDSGTGAETIAIFRDSSSITAGIEFRDGTSTSTKHAPVIIAINDTDGAGDKQGLSIISQLDNDVNDISEFAMDFDVRNGVSSAFSTKTSLFRWRNHTTTLMELNQTGLGIGVTPTSQLHVLGTIESDAFSSELNSQTEDTGSTSTATQVWWNGGANVWAVGQGAWGSFDQVFLEYPTNAYDISLLALQLSKIKITVDNPTFVLGTGGDTFNVTWYYTTDAGSSWTLAGTDNGVTGASGTIDFDILTIDIDGIDVTDDVNVQISVERGSGSDTIDMGNWTASYSIALKTP